MNSSESEYEIVTEESALQALKAEWDDLWTRTNGSYYESFDFCWAAWQQVSKPKKRRLQCIVRRDEGKLALVWPLVVHIRLLWACLYPLCPESADYSGMLIDIKMAAADWVEGAWRIAMQGCSADFIHLPYVHEDTDLFRVASSARSLAIQASNRSYVAKISEECIGLDWVTFCNSLGTLHGRKPGSVARRLAKKGQIEWRLIDPCDKAVVVSAIDMMLEWKRKWSDRVGKHGPWIDSVHYRKFLIEWISSQSISCCARLLVITLNGDPLTSLVFCVDNCRVSTIIGSFNPAYRNLSPGVLAFEYVVKWAFDRQLDVDFGSGTEQYKKFWARENVTNVWTLRAVTSWWGRIGMHLQRVPLKRITGATHD